MILRPVAAKERHAGRCPASRRETACAITGQRDTSGFRFALPGCLTTIQGAPRTDKLWDLQMSSDTGNADFIVNSAIALGDAVDADDQRVLLCGDGHCDGVPFRWAMPRGNESGGLLVKPLKQVRAGVAASIGWPDPGKGTRTGPDDSGVTPN
jgi:hypothetical protein